MFLNIKNQANFNYNPLRIYIFLSSEHVSHVNCTYNLSDKQNISSEFVQSSRLDKTELGFLFSHWRAAETNGKHNIATLSLSELI